MKGGGDPGPAAIGALPDALERLPEIRSRLEGRPLAVFLDFDGTLAPIAEDPGDVALAEETRRAVRALARRCPVAILSGRDLQDVTRRVGIDGIFYAGSHGLDVMGPGGMRERRGEEQLPALDRAEERLRRAADAWPGVRVERKRLGVAVHYRGAAEERGEEVRGRVRRLAAESAGLELHEGKQVVELRPAVDWDKGRALRWILERLPSAASARCPVYLGDDVTDEDAFAAVAGDGIGVVVRGEDDDRPTLAEYSLEGPGVVGRFLRALEAHRGRSED